MEKSCYSVIVHVGPASDVDDAAEKAYEMLKDGYTPDFIIPTAAVEELTTALDHMIKDAEDMGKKPKFRGFVTQPTIDRANAALLTFKGGRA